MPFVNDDQRKAAFARMRGSKGARRPGGRPLPPLTGPGTGPGLDVILAGLFDTASGGGNSGFTALPNGPGIPGFGPGTWTGTGGAIYATPGSSWFLNQSQPAQPNYGNYSGPGVGPYVTPVFSGYPQPSYPKFGQPGYTVPFSEALGLGSYGAGILPWGEGPLTGYK